jgi:hypothetical protein
MDTRKTIRAKKEKGEDSNQSLRRSQPIFFPNYKKIEEDDTREEDSPRMLFPRLPWFLLASLGGSVVW